MAEAKLTFSVIIMPPPKLAASSHTGQPPSHTPQQPLSRFLMAVRLSETFEDVWAKIEQRYRASYNDEKRVGMEFSRIQNHGSDIFLPDTVGDLFSERTPKEDLELCVQQITVEHRDFSIAVASNLRPQGFKRRKLSDLAPSQQDLFKRRKLQENRYGATVDELNPNMPLMSHEPAEGGVEDGRTENAEGGEEQLERYDDQGFKIPPRKIARPHGRLNAHPNPSPMVEVLVKDSQPQYGALQHPRPDTAVRQKHNGTNERLRSGQPTPIDSSSPAAQAAVRANTSPQNRGSRPPRPGKLTVPTVQHPATSHGSESGILPTPDSDKRRRSSNETPTSAQRPRSSQAPHSNHARRFLSRPGAADREAQRDITEDDPIEDLDDVLLRGMDEEMVNGAEDEDNIPEDDSRPRGRTRSRSVESIPQHGLPSKATHRRSSLTLTGEIQTPQLTNNPRSGNAFDELTSSQAARAVKERSASNGKKWSKKEDKLLLQGIRKGWSVAKIVKVYGVNRSESAIRNRRRLLQKKFPGGVVPSTSEVFEGSESDDESGKETKVDPPSSRRQVWSQNVIGDMRKAMGQGYGAFEIRIAMFTDRSEEAVAKKFRELEPVVSTPNLIPKIATCVLSSSCFLNTSREFETPADRPSSLGMEE